MTVIKTNQRYWYVEVFIQYRSSYNNSKHKIKAFNKIIFIICNNNKNKDNSVYLKRRFDAYTFKFNLKHEFY